MPVLRLFINRKINFMNLPVNTLLQGGKYKIVRFISSGGFGCTYEAEHVMLEKQVAIKEFFVKDFCNRDEATAHVTVGTLSKKGLVEKLRRKFVDEAKALCRLQHPGIVRVSDVFEENGTAYFVMDYIDGRSLGDIVKEDGPLSEGRALKYIREVVEALQYVHDHNRLHLDLKPNNVIIDDKDHAVLIDFGASKQYDEQDGENTSTLLGKTPGYAPLEQMGNDVVKFMPATDIYALGATFYKLLTGITPPSANLLASGEELEPFPPVISTSTRKAIASSMELNKNKRPQTVQAFCAILNESVKLVDEVTVINAFDSNSYHEQEKEDKPQSVASKFAISKRTINFYATIVACVVCMVVIIFSLIPDSPENVVDFNYTNTNGVTFVYSGTINSLGAPEGVGKGVYLAGTYHGEYKNGIRQGKGTFDTSDGSNHFEGSFERDSYSEGRLTLEDGSYFEGTFENNNFYTGKWYNQDHSFDSEMRNGEYI